MAGSPNPCECEICKHCHTFELPNEILDAAIGHRLVIFAGAGISTENPAVMPYTFYDDVAAELGHDPRKITTPFPALMTELCEQPQGRRKLLQKIRSRFDYIESFPTLLRTATRFHRELSTIPHLNDIVTTNWDPYFEDYCAALPVVSPSDFVFWDLPGRKVFKIHGSVSSYSSIVATDEDYRVCDQQLLSGIVGSNLRLLLATKVVVFLGYSMRDPDFLKLHGLLRDEMQGMLPPAYAVTPSADCLERCNALGVRPVVTDGTYFVEILKRHLVAAGAMIADDRFEGIADELERLRDEHQRLHEVFSCRANPEMVYCAFYQDGVMDALERIEQRGKTGQYSCPGYLHGIVLEYGRLQAEKRKARKYADVAYIEGYVNGVQYLFMDDKVRRIMPRYYVYGYKGEITTLNQYKRVCRNARNIHRAAHTRASRMTKEMPDGMVFHHAPMLR